MTRRKGFEGVCVALPVHHHHFVIIIGVRKQRGEAPFERIVCAVVDDQYGDAHAGIMCADRPLTWQTDLRMLLTVQRLLWLFAAACFSLPVWSFLRATPDMPLVLKAL